MGSAARGTPRGTPKDITRSRGSARPGGEVISLGVPLAPAWGFVFIFLVVFFVSWFLTNKNNKNPKIIFGFSGFKPIKTKNTKKPMSNSSMKCQL